ncbi:MAG: acyltransferase [Rhodanobacteraceae bacterium]|nr:acyltransferase [Rhodanobacteraceae bacterium]
MSGERHWADIGEAGFVGGMRFLVWTYRWFGRLPFRIALYPVLGYFFLVRGIARRASLEYLGRLQAAHAVFVRPPGLGTAWRHFLSFADALLDKVLAMGGAFTLEQITMDNQQVVLPLLDAGRGAVMLTAHVGNLEVCQALAELQPRLLLNILVHHVNAQKFNRLLERQGASQVRLIEVTEITPATAMELERRVAAGEMLVIAADRLTPGSARRSLAVPFLGPRRALPARPVHPRQPAALPGVPGFLHPPRRLLPHRFRNLRRAHRAGPRRAGRGPASVDRALRRTRRAAMPPGAAAVVQFLSLLGAPRLTAAFSRHRRARLSSVLHAVPTPPRCPTATRRLSASTASH